MNRISSYEDYLEKNGTLTFTNVGTSMMPLLRQGKDLFTVVKKGRDRCRPGDVVLYRRAPKKYVLHRVVEVRQKDYVILGDACAVKEYGIRDDQILGIMTAYIRNGKEHSVNEAGYRLYSFLLLHSIGIRLVLIKTGTRLKRRVKKAVGL